MKKKILSAISLVIAILTVLSCFSGCSELINGDHTDDSSALSDKISDIIEETEKETQKPKKTTAKKSETTPVPGKTTTKVNLVDKEYDLSQKNQAFKLVGRAKYTSTGIMFDHCAVALEFQGYMTGDLKLTASSAGNDGRTYYTVFVDGKRLEKRFLIDGIDQTITLATFTGKYFHTVRIIKQTEPSNSDSRLKKLTMTGYLTKAPENQKYYIEYYGDSLTAGYGNIGKPGYSNAGSSEWQDATKSYAFLASEALKADCSILAMSGVGVDKGWASHPFMYYFSKYSYRRGDEAFSFEGARVPDLVVIHLGANDITKGSTRENFVKKGKELINYIYNGYGKKMPIIWAYDPSEQVPDSWRQEVLDAFGGEAKGLYSLKLEWRSIGAGAGGHPSAAAHEKHAELLVDLVKKKNLLK